MYSVLRGLCCSQPCVLDVVFFTRVSTQSKPAYVPDGQDGVEGGWGWGSWEGAARPGGVGWVLDGCMEWELDCIIDMQGGEWSSF